MSRYIVPLRGQSDLLYDVPETVILPRSHGFSTLPWPTMDEDPLLVNQTWASQLYRVAGSIPYGLLGSAYEYGSEEEWYYGGFKEAGLLEPQLGVIYAAVRNTPSGF